MWGSNKYGQLGIGDYEDRNCPTEIQIITNSLDEQPL